MDEQKKVLVLNKRNPNVLLYKMVYLDNSIKIKSSLPIKYFDFYFDRKIIEISEYK
jgi:hypothetical protein